MLKNLKEEDDRKKTAKKAAEKAEEDAKLQPKRDLVNKINAIYDLFSDLPPIPSNKNVLNKTRLWNYDLILKTTLLMLKICFYIIIIKR